MKKLLILPLLLSLCFSAIAQLGTSDDFTDGDFTGWTGNASYTLAISSISGNNALRVSASAAGKNYTFLPFQFSSVNVQDNPYVSVKIRAGAGTGNFIMRIDMMDVNGRITNRSDVKNNITADGNYNEYTFAFSDFYQQYGTNNGPVDPTQIVGIYIYLNPGSSSTAGYTGTILLDDVKIGDQATLVSGSAALKTIKLSQIGFFPESQKIAIVNGATSATFNITTEDGSQVVYSGTLSDLNNWTFSGEFVRSADFSDFKTPGTYRITAPGVPNPSYVFKISDKVYNDIEKSAIKMYYYQRASMALTSTYAGTWARAAGHPDNTVYIHASAATTARPTNTVVSGPKGWYDAGDYNKYVVNSGISTYTMLAAYEHFSSYFDTLSINIPENTNQIPDILDEALWNLEWMLTMQDPNDGGVYHKLTNANFDGNVMPANATSARYMVQKSTAAALNFTAVMAQAARIFSKFETQKPGFSAQCMAAALKAYQWALDNPSLYYNQSTLNANYSPSINTGGYGDNTVTDEFNWAVAELFLATKKPTYFSNYNSSQWTDVPSWPTTNMLGLISLNHYRKQVYEVVDTTFLRDKLITIASGLRDHAINSSAYKIPMGAGGTGNFNWGSNSIAANQSLVLLQAFYYTNDSTYLKAAMSNMDYILGRNPLNYCFITGYGTKSPASPHHRPMESDNISAPIPGFLVGGPYASASTTGDCSNYPSSLAALSYLDMTCSYSTNEIAINWNAPMVYNLGSIQALYAGGRPNDFTYTVTQPTSTKNAVIKNANILLYPNPANDRVTIEMPYKIDGSIEMVDLQGRVKSINYVESSNQIEFNVNGMDKGLYLIKIQTESGIIVDKIQIQ
ncbi:MAG: glycoside hydrolase family 9 protein [Cytophagaceae bacterium]